jgi:hypothetical protein
MDIEQQVKAVSEWLRICEHYGRGTRDVDADHSALLRRLLSGKPALKAPPPKLYSYPCYPLGEGKKVEIRDLWQMDDKTWVIGQCVDWEQIEEKTPDSVILRHTVSGHIYRLTTEEGKHILQKI